MGVTLGEFVVWVAVGMIAGTLIGAKTVLTTHQTGLSLSQGVTMPQVQPSPN